MTNDSENASFREVLSWLIRHASFPTRRLDAKAEGMLCVAALSLAQEREEQERYLIQSRDPAQTSALKTHAQRRSQVHFKCDNSAKV